MRGRGQRWSHGPQLPAGCVRDVEKKGRETRWSGGEVVCSGATGRGLDDAQLEAFLTRRREAEKRGRGRHAGDRGEWEHTHLCNLIIESSRCSPLLLKAADIRAHRDMEPRNRHKHRGHANTHTHACRRPKHLFNHTLVNKHTAQWPDSIRILKLGSYLATVPAWSLSSILEISVSPV